LFKLFILCIVSIFSNSSGDFILTQNRDESILRPSSQKAERRTVFGQEYTGPVDLVSEGTWIYYSEKYTCCILNGAYQKHTHRPPYRLSRGLIILELLKFESIDKFVATIELNSIEPFTMIMLNRQSTEKKILVWDEYQKHVEDVSDQKLIVRSSSTLYNDNEKDLHRKAFENLEEVLPDRIFSIQDQLKMLETKKFSSVLSTSITQIVQDKNGINLKFCPIKI